MLRQRLVRQSAINPSGTDDTLALDGGSSGGDGLFRPVSSDSFETLLELPPKPEKDSGKRRHSVACGSLVIDLQKPSLKSAVNSAFRRMSNACSYLTSMSSSQPSLNSNSSEKSGSKSDKIVFPPVLETFRCGLPNKASSPIAFESNRRFSTDFSPPSYQTATQPWKVPTLVRQQKFYGASDLQDMEETTFTKSNSSSCESETEQSDLQEVVSE